MAPVTSTPALLVIGALLTLLAACAATEGERERGGNATQASSPAETCELGGTDLAALEVSYEELVAAPARFDGKLIRTVGVLEMTKENEAIYSSEVDRRRRTRPRGLWLEFADPALRTQAVRRCRGQRVMVEGIVRAGEHGHMDAFLAELQAVASLRSTP
jgi:hypothetical protein